MPKLNVLSFLDRPPAVETREFTDPAQPGQVLALTLQAAEYPDIMVAQEIAAGLAATWVPAEGKPHPPPWPPPPQRPIRWSLRLCAVLALIEALQCPPDPEDRYDALELAVISVRMPAAWEAVAAWAQELEAAAQGSPAGNASAAREETSSAPPATLAELTPLSTTITPMPSGA